MVFAFRGRVRTCVNVWGDCVGVGIVEKLSRKELLASADSQDVDDEGLPGDIEMGEIDKEADELRKRC